MPRAMKVKSFMDAQASVIEAQWEDVTERGTE